jgi:hypothetical protein
MDNLSAHRIPAVHAPDIVGAVAGPLLFIILISLLREPTRQRFNAVFVAGAATAYLRGGFGPWEMILPVLVALCAFKGLTSYRFIGLAWLIHAGWDVLHHLHGNPILPFMPASSAGCALCDTLLAVWFLAGAPSPWALLRPREMSTNDLR